MVLPLAHGDESGERSHHDRAAVRWTESTKGSTMITVLLSLFAVFCCVLYLDSPGFRCDLTRLRDQRRRRRAARR